MNKMVLIVVAPKDFRDEEYLAPRQILEKGGIEIKVASLRSGEVKGVAGTVAPIDLTVDQVRTADFDAVIFVGGAGMLKLVADARLTNLAKSFYEAGKITAAICCGPMILANAGLLAGKNATVYSGGAGDLKSQGAKYTGESVTVDGKIITGNGPAAAREFGEKVLEVL